MKRWLSINRDEKLIKYLTNLVTKMVNKFLNAVMGLLKKVYPDSVVGSAITRPQLIAEKFVDAISLSGK